MAPRWPQATMALNTVTSTPHTSKGDVPQLQSVSSAISYSQTWNQLLRSSEKYSNNPPCVRSSSELRTRRNARSEDTKRLFNHQKLCRTEQFTSKRLQLRQRKTCSALGSGSGVSQWLTTSVPNRRSVQSASLKLDRLLYLRPWTGPPAGPSALNWTAWLTWSTRRFPYIVARHSPSHLNTTIKHRYTVA